jgi:hypothetical protein
MKNYLSVLKRFSNQVNALYNKLVPEQVVYDLKNPKVLTGRLFAELNNQRTIADLQEAEFQVFSQWGDDGIIQYLIRKIDIPNKTFIEFGVENYTEANTRFLVINNNWSGLVLDGSEANVEYIKKDPISWAHEIHSWAAFITRENINSLLRKFLDLGFEKEVGILSVDIDGNDYWVWKEINEVNPVIVIAEYNSVWGHDNAWAVPYTPDFYRMSEGNSILHYGASLLSLCDLADEKGYFFVGCNSAGNNAYFIRKDKITDLKPLTAERGYVVSKFREAKMPDGTMISGKDRLKSLIGRKVYNTRTQQIETL